MPTSLAQALTAVLATAVPVAFCQLDSSIDTVVKPAPSSGIPKFCNLPSDSGPCDGDFRKYYFSPSLGCQPFQYGGCKGNANRFDSLKECENVCLGLSLPPCKQPIVPGPCKGSFPRWGFNGGECVDFIYGGCGGNNNNFMSLEECEKTCEPAPVPVCEQPTDPGPCLGSFPRWTFNGKTDQCEKFVYGGCPGNDNRFDSEKECAKMCEKPVDDICDLDIVPGPCRASIPSWGFDGKECVPFTYGGCRGNANRFETEEACQKACGGDEDDEDICLLPVYPPDQTVFCRAAIPAYTYNAKMGQCVSIVYSGCGGTANVFFSKKECISACGGRGDVLRG